MARLTLGVCAKGLMAESATRYSGPSWRIRMTRLIAPLPPFPVPLRRRGKWPRRTGLSFPPFFHQPHHQLTYITIWPQVGTGRIARLLHEGDGFVAEVNFRLFFAPLLLPDLRPDDDDDVNGRNSLFDCSGSHNMFPGDDRMVVLWDHTCPLELPLGRRGLLPEPGPQRISHSSQTDCGDCKQDAIDHRSLSGEV